MMICYINKKPAYPLAQSDVKITLINPFMKDGDEKSMEVVFPLSIPENQLIFGTINRLDTHFYSDSFEDVRLMADGVEVISGTGTITSVTDKEVKLQILSGKSYLRFKASFDKTYIDDIFYGDLKPRHEVLNGKPQQSKGVFDMSRDISSHGFVGEPGMYAFLPIHDETNDFHLNMPTYFYTDDYKAAGYSITLKAIQPNLMYVMKKVMEKLGYTIERNVFDAEPWNRIYVASAKLTTVMSRALPHWTAYKFLDEFRKLFNATYIFNEGSKSVSIVPFGESGDASFEVVEPLEEFSTSFDEEGVEYLGSSNIEYELSNCDRDYDMLSQDILKAFQKKEYDSINDLYNAFASMSTQEKMTTIFHCPVGFFYGKALQDENGEITAYVLSECGWFSPLVRTDGGSTVTLHIVPVAMKAQKARCVTIRLTNWEYLTHGTGWRTMGGQPYEYDSIEANMEVDYPANEQMKTFSDGDIQTNSLPYVTVQDVIEEGESLPDRSDEDGLMEIFFAAGTLLHSSELAFWGPDRLIAFQIHSVDQPVAFTDYRHAVYYASVPAWSLGLNPLDSVRSIGYYHNHGIKIRRNVNGNNEICIPFLFNGKPDPRKIYIIRNKKYVCSRIEMAVGENGIEEVKTGYFYEML